MPGAFRSNLQRLNFQDQNLYSQSNVDFTSPKSPKFITHINDVLGKREGDSLHFECRLEPVGEDTPQIEWYFNGNPLITGNFIFYCVNFR